jgi:pimeloyl-ACP methyl ester carboxylesterase
MPSSRVKYGPETLGRRVYDFVAIGGGPGGMNCMAAIKYCKPDSTALCVSVTPPGGSWNFYYDFVRLHQPHPMFGVAGHPWHLEDPNELAARPDVLKHFNDFVDKMPAGFDFSSNTRYIKTEVVEGDLKKVTLESTNTGKIYTVLAQTVFDGRGFNFGGFRRADQDRFNEGSVVPEIDSSELPRALCNNAQQGKNTYVIIGGGKCGMDAVLHLAHNKREIDEIVLITGRNKSFTVRSMMFPDKRTLDDDHHADVSVGDFFVDMVESYDGTNAVDCIKRHIAKGWTHTLFGKEATSNSFGMLGIDEREIIEKSCKEIVFDDYFVSTEYSEGNSSLIQINFKNRSPMIFDNNVVLVNCRSSFGDEGNTYANTVHPIRPDGTIRTGSLGGFTGPSGYLIGIIAIKHPEKLKTMALFGFKHGTNMQKTGLKADWGCEMSIMALANTLSIADVVGMDDFQTNSLDLMSWYPPSQLEKFMNVAMSKAEMIFEKAGRLGRLLEPFDVQPYIAGEEDAGYAAFENIEVSRLTNSARSSADRSLSVPKIAEVTATVKLAYYEYGPKNGPLVILLHGFPECGKTGFSRQVHVLADAGYHVITPDQRGYGDSFSPKAGMNGENYQLTELVGDIVGLVFALGEKNAILAGHDWGCAICQFSCALRPDIFTAMILMSVPYLCHPANVAPLSQTFAELIPKGMTHYQQFFCMKDTAQKCDENLKDFLLSTLINWSGMEGCGSDLMTEKTPTFPVIFPDTMMEEHPIPWVTICPKPVTLESVPFVSAEDFQANLNALKKWPSLGMQGPLAWYKAFMNSDNLLLPLLANRIVTMPTLFIVGEKDPCIGPLMFKEAMDAHNLTLPGLKASIIVKGAGHWVQHENPSEVNKALLDFLKQVAPTAQN